MEHRSPARLLLLVTMFGLSLLSNAQTLRLTGSVTDAEGDPLVGVNVTVVEAEKGTTTDPMGRYVVVDLAPGEYTIKVSALGYVGPVQRLNMHNDTDLSIRMEPAAIDLKEVAVAPERSNSTTEVIQALDVRTRPVNNSQELLQLVPGLFIAQHAGGGKAEQIFFRGFDIDHGTDLQVSADGMPVNMVSHAHGQGYADLHFVIPETIDKLHVHKGPYDARFGDFATSGTVEFQTRNSIDKSEVKVEAGMFDSKRAVAQIRLLDKRHFLSQRKESAYIAGEYAFTDAYFNSKQDFNRMNLFGKYAGQLGEHTHLTLSASTFGAAWNASGQVPQRAIEAGRIDRFGAIDDDEGGNTTRTNAYATLTNAMENGGLFKNQLYVVKYDFNLYSNFTFFAADSVNGDMIAQTDDRTIYGYTGSYGRTTSLGGLPFRFNAGLGARYDKADISLKNAVERVVFDTIVSGELDQLNANAYVDGSVNLTEKFRINAAARLDVFRFMYTDAQGVDSVSGDAVQQRVSPKLNFTYEVSDRAQIYLRTGMGFHSNDARAVVVDKASRTLPRAYGADLGTNFKPTSRMLVNVALFGLYLESELVFVGDGGVVETSNATQRVGIDFSLRYQVAKKLFADIDVNAVQGRIQDVPEGEDLIPLAPNFTTIGGLAY
ncbi:MAG: TonB-dependent receptor, partial [Flavobacteriales bacterium]|nr:TonB-dependent receptor [Flavobacteriales bacterium]